MRLAELQHAFWSLAAASEPERGLDPDRLFSAGHGIEIYRHAFLARQLDALREDFPKLATLLGEAEFASLAHQYLELHPSSHHSIARLGHALSAFLSSSANARPDLGDLAGLEWARVEVFVEAEVTVLTQPASFDRPLTFIPALRRLHLQHDVFAVWGALEAGESAPPARASSDTVVVWRKHFDVYHVRLEPAEADAFERAARGESLACICEAFADHAEPEQAAFRALSSWFVEGWIGSSTQ